MFVLRHTMVLILLAGLVLLNTHSLPAQDKKVEIWTFDELSAYLESDDNDLKIVNFWATWCAPCIKELPHFEKANSNLDHVSVLLVSLDFADQLENKVMPFVARKNLQSEVVILGDEDYNSWINRIDPNWSGAIPATLFIKPDGSRHFHEGEYTEKELFENIDRLSKQ